MARRVFEFRRPECLSPLEHDLEDTNDVQRHFFGCISIGDRVDFLRKDNPFWEYIARDGREWRPVSSAEERLREAIRKDEMRRDVCDSLYETLTRTDILRKAIREDEMFKHFIVNIDTSREAWKSKKRFLARGAPERETADGWPNVRVLLREISENREERGADILEVGDAGKQGKEGTKIADDIGEGAKDQVLPESAEKATVSPTAISSPGGAAGDHATTEDEDIPRYRIERDVKARVLRFTRIRDGGQQRFSGVPNSPEDKPFKGVFPDQQIAFCYCVGADGKFSRKKHSEKCESKDETLTHYHIPCNNMSVCT